MPPDRTYLLLDELLVMLSDEGFQTGLQVHFRLRRLLDRLGQRTEPITSAQLKFQLGALLCQSADAQKHFYLLFEKFAQPYWEQSADEYLVPEPTLSPESVQKPPVPTSSNSSFTTEPLAPVPKRKPVKTKGRSGPIRIDLHFVNDNFRAWNIPEMDYALRPLREKEWTAVQEWDITASIHRTIRTGGIPHFVQRYRKKAPQYLLLIDQKSPRDHLACLYADLATEMNRRDLDAEFYFYDFVPYRCWRDPRDQRTHTNIESLQSQYPDAKLLLIGDVEGLIDFPDLRPSNLALDLFDNWRELALLSPKSTADWGDAEWALCPLFPIVPANPIGLSTLVRQWNATELFTPSYWQNVYPEPSLTDPLPDEDSAESLENSIENLYYYLGFNGFQWLCAAAVYPEIYWDLTKLLHDESIPPDRSLNEWDQNRVWQVALLRMSRVRWFRQGGIPGPVRSRLRKHFDTELPAEQRREIRRQLLEVLDLNKDRFPPGSYADVNRAFTIAWYEYENAISAPHLSLTERERIEAEFQEKGLVKIQLSEIEDAVGRELWSRKTLEMEIAETEIFLERRVENPVQPVSSEQEFQNIRIWEKILDSYKNGTIISGKVLYRVKGGFIFNYEGSETFLPGSQVDIKPVIDYDLYVGKVLEVRVVKVNLTIKNAVVSHRAILESFSVENRERILRNLEKGQILEGVVKNITDYGAFLDLGGVDGLLYITDITWGRINHPNDVLELNQQIKVIVLDFDEPKKRIALGLKQLSPQPWDILSKDIIAGAIVIGKVVNIEEYGAFVEILPGVEGLIHNSEITWRNKIVNPKEFFKLGEEVKTRIVSIDPSEHKLLLSIKQLIADPWSTINEDYSIGSKHTGIVKNITNYGIFVELSNDLTGMVHISELSWIKRYAHPSEFTKAGALIEVVILGIDHEKRQIELSHRQVHENPWHRLEALFLVGSEHEAIMLRRDDKGAIFQMPHALEAFAPSKHIFKEGNQPINVGDTVIVKVIEFNKDERRILVSYISDLEDIKYQAEVTVKAEQNYEKGEIQANERDEENSERRETLGDLAALARLKKLLEGNAENEDTVEG